MAVNDLIVWLDDPRAAGNASLGGKFGSLGTSVADGLPVPPGFGITTQAYRLFLRESGLEAEASRVRKAAAVLQPEDIAREAAGIVKSFNEAPLPAVLADAIGGAYAELGRRCDQIAPPVAVRSSGESEDLAGASFAGQYDTYLWVRGVDSVVAHMRRCWAGLFGEAVLSYRPKGVAVVALGDFAICVGVQRMVEARAAGVMFTLDPLNGDRSKVVVEAVWGLGEGVVKGDVTPSRFSVDKVSRDFAVRSVSPQEEEYRFDPASGTVGLFPVEGDRRERCCVSDEEVLRLVQLGREIEMMRGGSPQDIEWAIGGDDSIAVLQVRPETVWSARPATPIKLAGPPIAHVLSRMSAPAVAMKTRD